MGSSASRAALAAKRAQGVRLGNSHNLAEAGAKGREVQADEADRFAASILPAIQAMKANGLVGLGALATALNARGIRTARGGRWHASSVRNLLLRSHRNVPE
jgi:hypothetical protein